MGLVVHEIKFCVRLEVIGNVVMRQERRVVAIILARQINIGLRIEDRRWRGGDRSIRNETGAIHAVGSEGIGSALRREKVRIVRSAAGNAGDGATLDGGYRVQGAAAEIAVAAGQRILMPITQKGGDVALAVGEVRAHQHVEGALAAVSDGACGRDLAGCSHGILSEGVVIVVLILSVLAIPLKAFEVFLHDEVDHAGDGVGAVGRGGAARDDLDTFDQARGNLIEVRSGLLDEGIRRALAQAAAVNQDQRAIRAQSAQIGSRHTAGGAQSGGGIPKILTQGVVEILRQLHQEIVHVSLAGYVDVLRRHDGDRTGAHLIRSGNARSGNDDLRKSGIGWLSCSGSLLCEGGPTRQAKGRRGEYWLPFRAESRRAHSAYREAAGGPSSESYSKHHVVLPDGPEPAP